jgi:ferredoxin
MFDNFFNILGKITNVTPTYNKDVCIAAKQSSAACHVCKDVCPHEAITLKRFVEIDDIDCTGCGLCVQSCPSQALESKVSYQPGAAVKCSQVKGSAQSVQCLTRLSPSDLIRLASNKNKVTLVRNDCSNCKIGTTAVPEKLEQTITKAKALVDFRKRDIDFQITIAEKYDSTDNPDKISRRDLLRGGLRGLQQTTADALAPLDISKDNDLTLPKEMQRHLAIIKAAKPEPEQAVPWVLPQINDGCIMCPVCTNVCPTKAFSRDFSDKNETKLLLEPDHCNGCNACVKACPVKVISLKENVSWAELSEGKHAVYVKNNQAPLGGVSRS